MASQKSIQKFFFNTTASPVPFISPTIINHNTNFYFKSHILGRNAVGYSSFGKEGPKTLKIDLAVVKQDIFPVAMFIFAPKTILTVIRNNPGGWKFGLTCKMFQL